MLKINRNNKIFHLTNTGDSQTNYKTNTRINEIYFFSFFLSFLTFDWTVKDVILLPTDNHLLWIDGIKIVEVRTRKIEIEEKKRKNFLADLRGSGIIFSFNVDVFHNFGQISQIIFT